VVNIENGRDQVKTVFEDQRVNDQKTDEAQQGKFAIDAHGNRVRMEEYLTRPDPDSIKFLFISDRQGQPLNWGTYAETFNSALPSDLSQIPAIVAGTFMNPNVSAPTTYLTIYDRKVTLGGPAFIDFAGLPGITAGANPDIPFGRWYPSTIDTQFFLGGPGVPGGAPLSSNGLWLVSQMSQAYSTNLLTFSQYVVDAKRDPVAGIGGLSDPTLLYQITVNPTLTGVTAGSFQLPTVVADPGCVYTTLCTPTLPASAVTTFPSGPNSADELVTTTFADGTTFTGESILVNADGSILAQSPNAPIPAVGNFNLEFIAGSSIFKGNGPIDVLIPPDVFSQIAAVSSIQPPPPPPPNGPPL
jgi:hypothetical protein